MNDDANFVTSVDKDSALNLLYQLEDILFLSNINDIVEMSFDYDAGGSKAVVRYRDYDSFKDICEEYDVEDGCLDTVYRDDNTKRMIGSAYLGKYRNSVQVWFCYDEKNGGANVREETA